MGYLKAVGTNFIYIGLFLVLITFMPGMPPEATFEAYSIVAPQELSGDLAINERLNNAKILFQGQIKNPESFASYNGELFASIEGGQIVKITDDKLIPIVNIGKECDGSLCSRPLGLKFDKKGTLYVADPLQGIFKVNIKSKNYEILINSDAFINNKKPKFINSLDVASNGDMYWSDSSTEIDLDEDALVFMMAANPSGRLIRYNAATKKNEVLLENLGIANGIAISANEDFVLVAEFSASRIMKYNIKGPKAGKSEIFIEGLPGLPDNIYPDNKNGFIVSLYCYTDFQHYQLMQYLAPHPYLRRMFAKLVTLFRAPVKYLRPNYPEYAEILNPYVEGFKKWLIAAPKIQAILRTNDKGKIVEAAYASDGKIGYISSAYIHGEHLWMISPVSEYVAKVELKRAFPNLDSQSAKSFQKSGKKSTSR